MTGSARIDIVAEAICEAEGHFWFNQFPETQDTYRRMAQAAIEALQLTEETMAGWADGDVLETNRLVSPWVPSEADAG